MWLYLCFKKRMLSSVPHLLHLIGAFPFQLPHSTQEPHVLAKTGWFPPWMWLQTPITANGKERSSGLLEATSSGQRIHRWSNRHWCAAPWKAVQMETWSLGERCWTWASFERAITRLISSCLSLDLGINGFLYRGAHRGSVNPTDPRILRELRLICRRSLLTPRGLIYGF